MSDADELASLGLSTELAKKLVSMINGVGGNVPATSVTVAAFTEGGVTFAGGNAQEALEAIAAETTS